MQGYVNYVEEEGTHIHLGVWKLARVVEFVEVYIWGVSGCLCGGIFV